jgi:putative membrane protein
MWWGDGGWGVWAWFAMSLLMLVFWAVVVAAVVLLDRWLGGRREPPGGGRPQSWQPRADEARRILDERFARGELTEDEYTHRRDVLDAR